VPHDLGSDDDSPARGFDENCLVACGVTGCREDPDPVHDSLVTSDGALLFGGASAHAESV